MRKSWKFIFDSILSIVNAVSYFIIKIFIGNV